MAYGFATCSTAETAVSSNLAMASISLRILGESGYVQIDVGTHVTVAMMVHTPVINIAMPDSHSMASQSLPGRRPSTERL